MEHTLKNIASVSEVIRNQRKKQRLTQQDLADLAGVSVRFLGNLERGKENCDIAKVLQVTSTLGIVLRYEVPEDDS